MAVTGADGSKPPTPETVCAGGNVIYNDTQFDNKKIHSCCFPRIKGQGAGKGRLTCCEKLRAAAGPGARRVKGSPPAWGKALRCCGGPHLADRGQEPVGQPRFGRQGRLRAAALTIRPPERASAWACPSLRLRALSRPDPSWVRGSTPWCAWSCKWLITRGQIGPIEGCALGGRSAWPGYRQSGDPFFPGSPIPGSTIFIDEPHPISDFITAGRRTGLPSALSNPWKLSKPGSFDTMD